MKRYRIGTRSSISTIVIAIVLFLAIGLWLTVEKQGSYKRNKMRPTRINLTLGRRGIKLFFEETGRFPDSLDELNEYGNKYPDKTSWPYHFVLSESISGRGSKERRSEHSVLDGNGGLYYNPKTGELKANLDKPLKSYLWFYFGKLRDSVPADW